MAQAVRAVSPSQRSHRPLWYEPSSVSDISGPPPPPPHDRVSHVAIYPTRDLAEEAEPLLRAAVLAGRRGRPGGDQVSMSRIARIPFTAEQGYYGKPPCSAANGMTVIPDKPPEREADVLRQSLRSLADRLPSTWKLVDVTTEVPADDRGARPDAVVELRAPEGATTVLAIEVKRTIAARDVDAQLDRLRRTIATLRLSGATPTLVGRYLPATTRERISAADASYLDATGNIRLQSERTPVFVAMTGAPRDPWRGPGRPRAGLRGAPAARVVRALADYRPPVSVPELANRSGASTGATYRVVDFLDEHALLDRQKRGPITAVRWRPMIERWSKDYGFDRADVVRGYLAPRGVDRTIELLRRSTRVMYVVTGSVAAQFDAPFAPARLLTAYVEDPDEAAEAFGLRLTDSGANVVLAANTDDFAFERARDLDGLRVAAVSQVAVDLMTGPGRGPAEAEALLDWMEENEDAWRR